MEGRLMPFSTTLIVDDVPATARFYVDHVGFRPAFASDWFTSLVASDDTCLELCFLQRGRAGLGAMPEDFRDQAAAGVILAFQVEDATAAEARWRAAHLPLLQPLRDEPFGQRHFIGADPNGVLIDVVQRIPPTPAWLEQQGPRPAAE
jgi:catechol 2,3-dioxygenase-like lactoylglutathione lyase family enzyme